MLKLVLREDERRPSHLQATLFPKSDPNSFLLVTLPLKSGTEFTKLVEVSSPRLIVDLRGVPRFDFDTLNRRKVFEVFSKNNCKYIDAGPKPADWAKGEEQWFENLSEQKPFSEMNSGQMSGPFMCLFGEYRQMSLFEHFLQRRLSMAHAASWSFFRVAQTEEFAAKRFTGRLS